MRSSISAPVLLAFGMLIGCGGEAPAPTTPSAPAAEPEPASTEEAPSAAAAAEPEPTGIPTQCSGKGSVCVPPAKWVQKLCADVHADVALFMFQSDMPWQHMYLTRETDAVNASGGASVGGKLAFDEEVLVLVHRGGDSGGIQVGSASGSYDALRWNGSCVSLDGEEVTNTVPPKPKYSRIEWRWLGDDVQEALRQNDEINKTYIARKAECKGVTMGEVSKKCEVLDDKLIEVVVKSVRGGSKIPEPKAKP
ncbi:MAG TPA: hypothetical protein VHM70_12325 [Polyangiaceae bacterium]|nr:hypothetical protein [Polyangiaceae bacterium]